MAVELSESQRQALGGSPGLPLQVIDPATQELYVLVPMEEYEQLRTLLAAERAEQDGWLGLARRARSQWAQENPY
ncbi:MAG TPA: hypothetical protein VGM03_02695 [Phycisphaerae bacterium]|jgi:acyl-CoA reductase-like NAD-dependent aldehyde dehydrogenase